MKKIILTAVVAVVLGSCTSTQLYSWHGYEDASYQNSKKNTPEAQAELMDQYQKMIEKQNDLRKVVPPGLYAEYGYMLYQNGKTEEGLVNLKKEIALYPESAPFISRIIKQLEKK
jgi:hypothetical protein